MLRLALAKLLTVKAAVAAAAVTAAGGAALAATGTIPNPISGLGSAPPADPPPATHAAPTTGATGDASPSPSPAGPSPSLEGLCVAYLAGAADDGGEVLDNPAFRALVDAAGGAEKVDEYCADLVPDADARRGHGKPAELPTPTDVPTPEDQPGPTHLPGSKDRPTPTDQPTPTDRPSAPGRPDR